MGDDRRGIFAWLRGSPAVDAPSATSVIVQAWAGVDSAKPGDFLQGVAESLCKLCSLHWVGVYVRTDGTLTRVSISIDESPQNAGAAPMEERDEPVLPGSVDVPSPGQAQDGWVTFADEEVWVLTSHPTRVEALLSESAEGAKALAAAVTSAAMWQRESKTLRKGEVDAEVHGTIVRAAMDQGATVELFLGIAISGFAGQRGFVGLWNPTEKSLRILATHGEIRGTMDGISIEELEGTWFANVVSNEHIAPDAKALYAIARDCGGEVLLCVVASASGAAALSEVTASRVEQALEIIGSLQAASHEAERARERGAAILKSLALMVDSDPNTARHHERVVEVAKWAGEALKLSDEERSDLARAAALHDVGRVGLGADASGAALEFLHPQVAGVLIQTFGETAEVGRLVQQHHERHDGLGFPEGLRPEDTDRVLWALVAAEAIVELAEREETSLEDAWTKWTSESSGVVPAGVKEALQDSHPPLA